VRKTSHHQIRRGTTHPRRGLSNTDLPSLRLVRLTHPHPSRHSNPEAESGPRTELDGGLKRGWYMDLPPTLKKKHWME
jgi:hypothetical protein